MRISKEEHDWLGSGAYFWESDAGRALEWAHERQARGAIAKAAVVGAVIDLRNCLDLTTRGDLQLLGDAYKTLKEAFDASGKTLPTNQNPRNGTGDDKVLRYLDCAVIEHFHNNIEAEAREVRARGKEPDIEPFDTVRGLFLEGDTLYDGGGFYTHTHTQIAVRYPERCIRGFFRPR